MRKDLYLDKIQGMLLAAAYGDALGAPHELDGLQGNAIDPLTIKKLALGCDFYHDEAMNQWSVWPPPKLVDQCCGIPTDDTAYRLAIFHPWMRHCLQHGIGFSESHFRTWLEDSLLDLNADQHSDWYLDCRNAQARQWIAMLDAEQTKEEAVFYIPDIPIVFGLFLYLELGAVFTGKPKSLIYTIFRSCTRLDQSYAGVITGLTAMLLAEAMQQNHQGRSFGDWFSEKSEAFAGDIVEMAANDDQDFAKRLVDVTAEMKKLGRKQRGRSEADAAAALKRDIYDHSEWFNPRLKNFDPLLFWMQMVAATSYAEDDAMKCLRILAGGAGDADTIPTVHGTLIGAYYGLQNMLPMTSADLKWGDELMEVQRCLEDFFDVSVQDEAELFWDVYCSQNPV